MAHGSSEPTSASTDVLQVQHQIRANASELQDYFADLYSWEKTINKEESERKGTAKTTQRGGVPLPRTRNATIVETTPSPAKPADSHTYDKGYKKWEKFDVEAALREDDNENTAVTSPRVEEIATGKASVGVAKKVVTVKSKASPASSKSREEIEKEEGNEHYKRGDYVAAIKSYTRALGFSSRNVVLLSNRAMAYLKNREYSKAEDDCMLALKIDDKHIKTYTRRGTARNSLGKHRLALLDFERALELDPKSKQIFSQVASTKELMRTAIKRAPKRTEFSIKVVGEPPKPKEPELDITAAPALDNKENTLRSVNRKIEIVEEQPVVAQAATAVSKSPLTATVTTQPPPPAPATAPSVSGVPLPKIPKKAPTTSYEFIRVWKTLAPKRGDPSRAQQLQELRGEYLRLLLPTSVASVFKNSIESEILCEIFSAVRQAFDVVGADTELTIELVSQLPLVPRFSMTVMFLSDAEKMDCAWVLDQLSQCEAVDKDMKAKLLQLKPLYGLK